MNSLPATPQTAYAILRKNKVPCAVQLGVPAAGGLHLESIRTSAAIADWCMRLQADDLDASAVTITHAQAGGSDHPRLASALPPIASRSYAGISDAPLVINPRVILCEGSTVPDEIGAPIRGFDLSFVFDLECAHAVLWVNDPNYGVWWPYRLDASQAWLVQNTQAEHYDAPSRALLQSIGFLIAPGEWQEGARPRIGSYWRMDGFLNHLQRQALSAYFADLMQSGLLKKGDCQTPHRYWAHNDAVARTIQLQTVPALRRLTGIDWEPTFTSFLGYEYPADLSCHTDREQATLTLSLLIDYRIGAQPVEDQWPIFIERREPSGKFDQTLIGLGNAIAFQGGQQKHYRNPLPEHHYSRSLCFHYAVPGFQGKRF